VTLEVANSRLVNEKVLQRLFDVMSARLLREGLRWTSTESLCQIRQLVTQVCLGTGVYPADVQKALAGMDIVGLKVLAVAFDTGNGKPVILRLEGEITENAIE
jgi:hypothetical protein